MSRPTDEYEKLRSIWYKKLEEEGFEDIEGHENALKEWSCDAPRRIGKANWQEKAEFFHIATHFLNEYEFEDELERVIWEYYSNGLTMVEIAKLLKDTNVSDIKKDAVHRRIKRLRNIMMKMYVND